MLSAVRRAVTTISPLLSPKVGDSSGNSLPCANAAVEVAERRSAQKTRLVELILMSSLPEVFRLVWLSLFSSSCAFRLTFDTYLGKGGAEDAGLIVWGIKGFELFAYFQNARAACPARCKGIVGAFLIEVEHRTIRKRRHRCAGKPFGRGRARRFDRDVFARQYAA